MKKARTSAARPPVDLRSTLVRLSEVVEAGQRLEASAFNVQARHAVDVMRRAGLVLKPLFGAGGFSQEAHNAFRFVRVYVKADRGVPFLSSADIISLQPEIDRFLSRKLTRRLEQLLIQKWDVLISCSGTIGNVGLAGASFAGKALSQDAIRVRAADATAAGYLTAFLRSHCGRLQLAQATYGSVVQHIEPQHLERVWVPELDAPRQEQIGTAMRLACEMRDEANRLLVESDRLLHESLGLPRVAELEPTQVGPVTTRLRASRLAGRLEASFHQPLTRSAEKALKSTGLAVRHLGDPDIAEVRAVTRFRKRVYVTAGGIPMLSSRQIFQVDPIDVKRLAKGAHTRDLPEIELRGRMILVSCSGTIGRVQIVPKYMQGWTANQHALRVIAAPLMNAGYLYAWLASDYGRLLISRYSYGSVILEIDREMLGSVSVPEPSPEVRDEIGELVARANALRDSAWSKEREAIDQLDSVVD